MTSIARNARRRITRRVAIIAVAGAAVLAILVPVGLGALQAAPNNTAQPTISGTPTVGANLTGTAGTWENASSYTYQWVRCAASGSAADGSDCTVIGGATTTAYSPSSDDVGFRLRFRVTATNGDGSTTAASNPTDIIQAAQQGPSNTKLPAITGKTVVGETLTANPGTWTGSGISYTYVWLRCDAAGANCAVIGGATATTYKLVSSDNGRTIRVKVTAKNADGSADATSAQTGVVTTASPATGCPAGTGPINIANLTPPARLSIGGQQIVPAVVTPGTQVIRVSFRVTACGGRVVQGALVYGTAVPYQQFSTTEQPTGSDGRVVLTMQQLRSFPASSKQQLLVIFARARKSGEDVLGGVSTRRLFSFKVNVRG
jgi:hypothetical protein